MGFNPSEPRVPSGQAGGGRWGAPRDAKAAEAQKNTGGQKSYTHIRSLPPSQRPAFVKNMSDGDLEALTAMLYSYPTSDPDVVNARIAVANEMAKRGLDIKKYGALGSGMQAVRKSAARRSAVHHALARHRAAQPAKPAPAQPTKSNVSSPGKRAI